MRQPADLLEKCAEILTQRGITYGDFRPVGRTMATLMGSQLGKEIDACDAMLLVAQLKMARIANGDRQEDSFLDAINYIALAWASAKSAQDRFKMPEI